jgi:integrase
MASIGKEQNGTKRISFSDASGKRKQIRLGKMSMRLAREVKTKVEDIVCASIAGHAPSQQTLHWIEEQRSNNCKLIEKLSDLGLVHREYRPSVPDTLEAFLVDYVAGRTDTKPSTHQVYKRVKRYLLDYFKNSRKLKDITKGEAKQWTRYLLNRGLAEATVRRSTGMARQFFNEALELKLISTNPFAGLSAVVRGNPSRLQFIDGDTIAKVIEACPNAEWRLLVGLGRYGGLRIPSEVVALRWGDVDWDKGTFTVTSSKTEHYEGKGSRVVPIFPELLPLFEEAFDMAEEGTEYVVQRYRSPSQNLRTQFQRIIKKAGVKPWPKLWQNLRSSRETELVERFPIQVVTAWLGNTTAVAMKHYLQVTDEHGRRATMEPTVVVRGGAKSAPSSCCTGRYREERGNSSKAVSVERASRNTHLHEQVGVSKWAIQDSNL